MSDNRLVECRNERDALRQEIQDLRDLMNTPEKAAIKRLKFRLKETKERLEFYKSKCVFQKGSLSDLKQKLDPLRTALKTTGNRAEIYLQQLNEIRDWFTKNGHPIVMGETIIEKLDNLQSIINAQHQMLHPDEEKKEDPNPFGLAKKLGDI